MIYGLRRYDIDRCAALIDQSNVTEDVKVRGYMSHKAKIYLVSLLLPHPDRRVHRFLYVGRRIRSYGAYLG